MVFYVPGTEETDPKKQNMSLQQIGAGLDTANTNIATNTAKIASIGTYVEASVASGSAVSLVTNTAKTITSISLTAGDWDVTGLLQSVPANTTVVSQFAGSFSLVNNLLDITPGRIVSPPMPAVTYNGTVGVHIPMPTYRFVLGATTTIFFVGYALFTTSTCSQFGIIRARLAAA